MAVALDTIVKQLADSGVIAQGQLENFVPPKAQPKDADELIAQLVKENHLTKFQAAQVAAGKSKSLILGEYTILDKIGAGGMGQVFKALHRRMDRMVAIKMLPPAMTKDAPAVARFEREVRAAAKLSHHNIVAAHDAGQAGGVHFLVMEYVEGKDLSALVKKNGPFPVAKATNYILQAARGLEFAHKRGVIHRDIKPANLLLDHEGTVKILDMGLARIESDGNVGAQAELTGTGTIMGTVDYMAPEQGMSTKHADARADIYSLGCSLYYLIAGKATYEGETMAAKLVAHHTQAIPDLRTVHPNVSERLEAVFKKMVAKRIEDRYQTMTEVIADLEQLGGNSGTVGNPIAATAVFDNQEFAFLKDAVATPKPAKATKNEPIVKLSNGKQPPWKNTKVLIGAGAAGFLFLLFGVIVIVRNKDGKEVARLEVNDGQSVEVRPIFSPNESVVTPANKNLPGNRPDSNATFSGGGVDYALDCSDGLTVEVPSSRMLPSEPMTIEITVRPKMVPTQEVSNSGLCRIGGLHLKQYSRRLRDQHVWSCVAVNDAKVETIIMSQNYVAGQTYRLATVSTGTELRLFIDGLLIATRQINGQLSSKPNQVWIGDTAKESNGWFAFQGLIDEVRISKVARYDKDYTPQVRLESDKQTVALYHCDEGSGDVLHDSSGNGHDGKIIGAEWVRADGSPAPPPSLSALQFDGKGLVEIPNVPWGKLDIFTLEAWVRADEKPAGRGYVVDRFQCSSLSSVAGHWQAVVHCRGQQVTYSYARNSLELDLGRWTHLANVVRDKTITLYVDGKKIASSPLDGEIDPQYGEKILLGSSFACAIRGVRISKTARYVADFTPLTHLAPDVDTLASYDFAVGSGDTLFDTSGHNLHGKIVRGAKWVQVEGSIPESSPLQTLDLLGMLDLQQDRVPAANFTGANNWVRSGDHVTYMTDGKSGRITLPVDVRNAGDFEIAADVQRLSGNSVFTLDFTTSDKLETGLDITIDGGIQLKVENDRRQKIGDWPPAAKDGGTIVVRVRRELPGELGSVDVSVNGVPAAHWQGAMAKIGKPWESHPSFPGKPSLRIFCYKDSFEFKSWQLRVYAGQVLSLRSSAIPPLAKAPFDAAQAKAHQEAWAKHLGTEVETTNSVGMKMVLIPPGEFLMGSTDEQVEAALKAADEMKAEQGAKDLIRLLERPQHRVVITKPYLMGATETTFGQYRKFVRATTHVFEDRTNSTDEMPVTGITWNDGVAYCQWLSTQENTIYRLPTEAEWEYACRAGTTTQYSFGDNYTDLDEYGWSNRNANNKSQPVGLKRPNPFGLFDMHGNVLEWCGDLCDDHWYAMSPVNDPTGPATGVHRVLRGGWWLYGASNCRSAYRDNFTPKPGNTGAGFRIVRELDAPSTTIDLLAKIDIARDKISGIWTRNGTTLATSGGKGQLKLHTPTPMPDEYDVDLVVQRKKPGGSGMVFGFLMKGHQATVMMDSYPSPHLWSIEQIDGMWNQKGNPTLNHGSRFPLDEKKPVRISVRRQGISVIVDGVSVINWTGRPEQLSTGFWKIDDSKTLFLGSQQEFVIHSLTLTPRGEALSSAPRTITPQPIIPAVAPATPITDWNSPEFLAWIKEVQAMPAEEQIKAVSKKLMELNPGFDGRIFGVYGNGSPRIENGVVTELSLNVVSVTDLSPIRALRGLRSLDCLGIRTFRSELSDLAALNGMPLERLSFPYTTVADLSPLRGMPLKVLLCYSTHVSDLTPLKALPLINLNCNGTMVSDLSPLEACPQLEKLEVRTSNVTPATVAALQKALPNCKIDWDDPAKPKTPQPAASGTK